VRLEVVYGAQGYARLEELKAEQQEALREEGLELAADIATDGKGKKNPKKIVVLEKQRAG
jgi:hypothetical protein